MNIVIAGASSGIGLRLSERLVTQGHRTWGLARTLPTAVSGRATTCDVSDWDQVVRAAEAVRVEPAWGYVDALIACAARQGPVGPAQTLDPRAWSEAIRVNLDGNFYLIRAFFELLRQAPRGRAKILCFSGGGATKARPNFSAYAASKTAVVRLVENLAEEWRGLPIDINAIAPGALPTRMTEEVIALGGAVGEAELAAAQRTLAQGATGYARLEGLVDFLLGASSDGISGRLIAAPWDPWETWGTEGIPGPDGDECTLRRVVPTEPGGKP